MEYKRICCASCKHLVSVPFRKALCCDAAYCTGCLPSEPEPCLSCHIAIPGHIRAWNNFLVFSRRAPQALQVGAAPQDGSGIQVYAEVYAIPVVEEGPILDDFDVQGLQGGGARADSQTAGRAHEPENVVVPPTPENGNQILRFCDSKLIIKPRLTKKQRLELFSLVQAALHSNAKICPLCGRATPGKSKTVQHVDDVHHITLPGVVSRRSNRNRAAVSEEQP